MQGLNGPAHGAPESQQFLLVPSAERDDLGDADVGPRRGNEPFEHKARECLLPVVSLELRLQQAVLRTLLVCQWLEAERLRDRRRQVAHYSSPVCHSKWSHPSRSGPSTSPSSRRSSASPYATLSSKMCMSYFRRSGGPRLARLGAH